MYQSWPFFGKIGQAKSVGFRFHSGIWRSESRISVRYLEITSVSLVYCLTYSRKKDYYFGLAGAWTDWPVWPFRSEKTLSWGISWLRYCDGRYFAMKNSYEIMHQYQDKIGCTSLWLFSLLLQRRAKLRIHDAQECIKVDHFGTSLGM